jgi:hypothetical protein
MVEWLTGQRMDRPTGLARVVGQPAKVTSSADAASWRLRFWRGVG